MYKEDNLTIEYKKYPLFCQLLNNKYNMTRDTEELKLSPAGSIQCLYEAIDFLSLEIEKMDVKNKDLFIVIGASRTGKGTLLAALHGAKLKFFTKNKKNQELAEAAVTKTVVG